MPRLRHRHAVPLPVWFLSSWPLAPDLSVILSPFTSTLLIQDLLTHDHDDDINRVLVSRLFHSRALAFALYSYGFAIADLT